jgi:16S rRNA (uracil1498-N3)-methyltransferase
MADEHEGDTAALTGEHAAHLARVLRARVGEEFDIAVGDSVRLGRITRVSDDRVEFALGEELPPGQAGNVTLVLAIFKFDRFEWAMEKATELGAARVIPFAAERTDAHLAAAARKRVERWRRIAREAAEQSRRVAPPEIADPAKFADVLKLEGGNRIVLAEFEQRVSLPEALAQGAAAPLTLAIGPEGGWAERELEQFAAAGWVRASLGTNILRTETAVVAALAVAQAFSARGAS